jgi:hypothetical protein
MGRCQASEVSLRSSYHFDRQVGDAQVLHLPAQGMRGVSLQRAQQLDSGKPDCPAAIAGLVLPMPLVLLVDCDP